MRAALLSASVVCMAAMASAFPSISPFHIAKRCETTYAVEFHYNDTSIGTMQSCTTDVTNRGGFLTTSSTTTRDTCVDGSNTNYTVVSGDTLEKIAAQFDSGVCNIAKANGLSNPDYILAGQVLIVPTDVCTADNDSCRTSEGTATCVSVGAGVSSIYTIVSGDTFFLIAARLGITLDSLVAVNSGVDAGNLQIGQVINIPICDD